MRLLRAISEGNVRPAAHAPSRPARGDWRRSSCARCTCPPKQRFESIHALGQKLWEFASPRGQAQWKTFYFHTPAMASPLAMAAPEPPAPASAPSVVATPAHLKDGKRSVDSTASLEPVAPFATTEPPQVTIGPSHFAITKTAAASGVGESTSQSHSDIAGESALSDASGASNSDRAARTKRWLAVLALAGAAGVGLVAILRLSPGRLPAAPLSASAASRPTPASATATDARPTPPPAPIVAPATPPPVAAPAPAPPVKRAKKKPATRRHKSPKTDQHGIGIPTE